MRTFEIFCLLASVVILAECQQSCTEKPCDSYTTSDQILNLLLMINDNDLTENGKKYKKILTDDLNNSDNEDQKSALLLLALWLFDACSKFTHPGLVCIYSNLAKKSLDYKNGVATKEELNAAFGEYGQVCDNATQYSIEISMKPTGCQYNLTVLSDTLPECLLNAETVNTCLNNAGDLISSDMKDIIKKMAKSKEHEDRVLAYSCMATFTDKSRDMVKALLKTNELSDAVKVKCCKEIVLPDCCSKRKELVEHRMKDLQRRLRQVMEDAMK